LVGYNHETGLALIHALRPLNKKPIEIATEDRIEEKMSVIVAPYGGEHHSICADGVSRREFCGSWEYMIDNAIFTAPIHPSWSGAALINEAGKLYGIVSLWVNDAMEARSNDNNQDVAGNLFVPSNLLTPIYNDLISYGVASAATRPWLGLYTSEVTDQLFVAGIVPDAPADKSDLKIGDLITGINNHSTASLAEMYKKIQSLGVASINITINIIRDGFDLDVLIKTDNHYNYADKRKKH
jgi:S1-C subfamily serine protease